MYPIEVTDYQDMALFQDLPHSQNGQLQIAVARNEYKESNSAFHRITLVLYFLIVTALE